MKSLNSHKRAQVLAGRDRHAAVAQDAGMTGRVVGDRRLLEPGEVERLQRAGGPDRLVDAPLHVGIRHQREVGAEVLAHRAHALDVLGELLAPDLHLDGAKALAEVAVGLAQKRVEGQIEVDAAGVARDAGVEAAEEVPQRQPGAAALQVPERHVEGREREHRRSAAAAVVERPPGLEPQALDVVGFLAGHDLDELAPQHRVDGAAVAPDRVGVADALGAVGVADPHRVELEGAHLAMGRIGQHLRQRDAEEAGFDRADGGHGDPRDGAPS